MKDPTKFLRGNSVVIFPSPSPNPTPHQLCPICQSPYSPQNSLIPSPLPLLEHLLSPGQLQELPVSPLTIHPPNWLGVKPRLCLTLYAPYCPQKLQPLYPDFQHPNFSLLPFPSSNPAFISPKHILLLYLLVTLLYPPKLLYLENPYLSFKTQLICLFLCDALLVLTQHQGMLQYQCTLPSKP